MRPDAPYLLTDVPPDRNLKCERGAKKRLQSLAGASGYDGFETLFRDFIGHPATEQRDDSQFADLTV